MYKCNGKYIDKAIARYTLLIYPPNTIHTLILLALHVAPQPFGKIDNKCALGHRTLALRPKWPREKLV